MKNSMCKRLLAAILALVMMLGVMSLLSCADDQQEGNGDTPADEGTTPDEGGETDEGAPEERLPLNLPEVNYNGAQIHVMEWSAGGQVDTGKGWIPWEEIDVDDYDGDLLTGAIYDRNSLIEETYGVVITKEYVSVDQGYDTKIRNNHNSGDDAYQVMTLRSLGITTFILENLMTNMYDLEHVDTGKIWWNQDSVSSYTLGSTLYFAAPELLLRDKGATAAMYYNSKVAADHEITDLYDLVKNGDWTWETFIDYCERVSTSLDGDDLMNSINDQWGIVGSDSDVFRLFSGTGIKFAHIDEDGYLAYDFGDEDSILKMQEVFEEIIYSDFFCHNGLVAFEGAATTAPFRSDNALFTIAGVREVNTMRAMTTDYGILPVPKYDSYQDDYSSLVWVHDDSVLGIPSAVEDEEMVGLIVEAMSYYSWYDVYPKFYDTVIMGRSTRDEQSKEMLEIVFRTRLYDPGQFWDSGSGASGIQNKYLRLPVTKESNISSIWSSYEEAVEKRFEEINTIIDESMW
ncbi:MAG: hypothetical protein IJW40_08855 [Clostridia bacterium]|nr:hypothetical protein [Clostridia bacterium]